MFGDVEVMWVRLRDRLLKSLVRDVFKDNMDIAFEHIASGQGGKVSRVAEGLFFYYYKHIRMYRVGR